jgi:arylsulfatase A
MMSAPPPNFVVFFADNLGYADIGAFGAAASVTPNIDRLAAEGLRLKQWNSGQSLCSPSRAALMTGRLNVRTGVYPHVFASDAVHGLPQTETTVAEYLQRAGFATACAGKWHMGQRPEYLPTRRGFDEYLGVPYSMDMGSLDASRIHSAIHCVTDVNGTAWLPLLHNEAVAEQPVDLSSLAQRYAAFARSFIRRSVAARKPFFLYVPFSHVHQLCAPSRGQWASLAFANASGVGPFEDAVMEMDWITGEVRTATLHPPHDPPPPHPPTH